MSATLFQGDNLQIMRSFSSETIDLVYIDPPFFSRRNYKGDNGSFSDIWKDVNEYLDWLNARLREIKRLLKKTGSIYVHCDHHASHHIKIEMDEIFGVENFRNEIIWYYNSGARKKKDFGRRHDTIFRYSIGEEYFVNFDSELAREPYSPDINIPASKAHYYDIRGKVVDDVWRIPIIAQNDKSERVGYPTQKPEKLLSRIIATSAPESGLVADFFCGSGTTLIAAQKLNMSSLGCDISKDAIEITKSRFSKIGIIPEIKELST